MFEDVGSKIQRLAKIIFFLCVVVGGFAFLFSLVSYFDNADYLEYATVYGGAGFRYSNLEEAGNAAYTALIVLKSSIAAIILREPLNKSPSFSAERENRRLPLGSSDSVGK